MLQYAHLRKLRKLILDLGNSSLQKQDAVVVVAVLELPQQPSCHGNMDAQISIFD